MLLREIREADYIKIGRLFTSKPGIEVLDILNRVFYNTVSFTPSEPDVSNFKEGQRDLVQIIRNAVSAVEKQERE
jgi:hypothetical protein